VSDSPQHVIAGGGRCVALVLVTPSASTMRAFGEPARAMGTPCWAETGILSDNEPDDGVAASLGANRVVSDFCGVPVFSFTPTLGVPLGVDLVRWSSSSVTATVLAALPSLPDGSKGSGAPSSWVAATECRHHSRRVPDPFGWWQFG